MVKKNYLKKKGPYILASRGRKCGLVDIGDGLGCAFKDRIRRQLALEPCSGAATGVGGINRDIFLQWVHVLSHN